ncbi:MAG TPA: glycerol-3-phosphate dehydrogenase C-terminal domain-containing protein, partial [Pyrinomonadaceae bacterium]
IKLADLPAKKSVTENWKIHGATENCELFGDLAIYGADAEAIAKIIAENSHMSEKLHPNLPYCAAEIIWAARNEMARTIEDALARRTRALFLDARAAIEIAPKTAEIMALELRKNSDWINEQIREFNATARNYLGD